MVKSLKTKLLFTCVLLALIPLLTISILQPVIVKSSITGDLKKNEITIAESNANTIDLWLQQKISELEVLAKDEEILKTGKPEEILQVLKEQALIDSDAKNLIYANYSGEGINNLNENYTLSDKDYFKKVKETKKTVVSDVIKNTTSEDKLIVFLTPILDNNNNFLGIIGMTFTTDWLDSLTNGIKIGDTGYAYILSDSETFITHPVEDRIGRTFKEVNSDAYPLFQQEVFKKDSAYVEYVAAIDNTNRMAVSKTISSTNWKIIITAPTNEVYSSINYMIKSAILIFTISAVVVILVGFILSSKIVKPIIAVSKLLHKTEKFDLIYDESFIWITKEKDELGKIGLAITTMRKALREIVGNIKMNSSVVNDHSKNLANVLEDNKVSLDSVAMAVDDMAHGATALAESTQSSAEKLEILSKDINDIFESSEEMKAVAENTQKATDNGIEVVKKLQEVIIQNEQNAKSVEEAVSILDTKSQNVGKITETIKNITSQVNLLSLNASIEAARAGEAGKGFVVVANEIKKLVYDTEASTKEIEKIIGEFRQVIGDAKDQMTEVKDVIDNTGVMSRQTREVFNIIDASVQNIAVKINSLAKSIKDVTNNKDLVVRSIEDISAVSEESASTTQEISASVEEQLSSIGKISQSASELATVAVNLQKIIGIFKV